MISTLPILAQTAIGWLSELNSLCLLSSLRVFFAISLYLNFGWTLIQALNFQSHLIRGIGKAEARKRLDEMGKTITIDKNFKNPYLKLEKIKKRVVKKAVKKAGLKRRK